MFFILSLSHDQFIVETLARDQLFISALFDQFSSIESNNQISVTNGTQSMSDDNRRSTFLRFVQGILNAAFTGVI